MLVRGSGGGIQYVLAPDVNRLQRVKKGKIFLRFRAAGVFHPLAVVGGLGTGKPCYSAFPNLK